MSLVYTVGTARLSEAGADISHLAETDAGISHLIETSLGIPALLSPANNASLGDITPDFTWSAVSGAITYTIHISRDSYFTSVIESYTGTALTYTLTTDTPATAYYWRVRANGSDYPGPWSKTRTFSIDLVKYLQTLGAVLILDGTLNGSNIKNLGSAGAALDGIPTAIMIDANGMNFNGTNSLIAVPSNATLQAWTPGTFVGGFRARSAGEGGAGILYCWGNTINELRLGGAGSPTAIDSFITREDTSSTDARGDTTTGLMVDEWMCIFRTYDDAGDRKSRVYKGVDNTVSMLDDATFQAATGTLLAKSGDFNIGNRTLQDRTFDGLIKFVAWIPEVISEAVMQHITIRTGLWLSESDLFRDIFLEYF